jgi:hypothetical protein
MKFHFVVTKKRRRTFISLFLSKTLPLDQKTNKFFIYKKYISLASPINISQTGVCTDKWLVSKLEITGATGAQTNLVDQGPTTAEEKF